MRALVVLPTYNEAENVIPLAADVLAQDERIDVLVVDDDDLRSICAEVSLPDRRAAAR